MAKNCKRIISFILAFSMIFSLTPNVFAAETNYIYVPEIEIEDEIKESNLFWLASPEIEMDENSNAHYLVRIGRGGDTSQKSSVVVKMSDITAKYGKDYKVYLHNGGWFNEADKEKDALSVIEMIEGQEYTEFEVSDTEELIDEIENGELSEDDIAVEMGKGLNEVVAENKASKGEDNSGYVEAADSVQLIEAEEFDNSSDAETVEPEISKPQTEETSEPDLSTLSGAKEAFTGIKSDRVKSEASFDIVDQFEQLQAYQDIADTISDSMTGATLEVEFSEGETEKYIEIVPLNNDDSDGTRIFNVTIGDPTGDYTVSAYSTAVATIIDDEEAVKAKVSLLSSIVSAPLGSEYVNITLTREGGINDLVSVMLKSRSGTAVSGRDFSPVSAEVVFPFGVTERTVQVPVSTANITEISDFEIYIDTPVSCEIGDNSVTLVELIPFDIGNNDVQLFLNETTYKQNARAYFPRVYTNNSNTRNIEKSGGFNDNCEAEGDYGWYIRPTDKRLWARAEFGINNEAITNRYDVNGLEFDYRAKYAASPHDGTAHVGFRLTTFDANGNALYTDEWGFTGGNTGNDWQSSKRIYTNAGNVRGVQVQAEDDSGSGRDIQAHFRDLYPIKRQFKITLAAADKMYLRTVNGDKVELTEVQPSAYISNKMSASLGIDAADTDTLAYRTSGEKLTITVGNNNYFTFEGLYAVHSTNPNQMIKIADANGNNSCTFELTNAQLAKLIHRDKKDNWDYVTLSDRSGGGKYGNITIKPVFKYIDRKVYVEKNTQFENKLSIETYNALGYLSVNGQSYPLDADTFNVEVKPNDSLGTTFHYGDEFVVKTNAGFPDIAKAAGVGYRTGVNLDTMNATRTDKKNANGSYAFTRKNSNDVLKNNVICFYPIYTEKENGLTLLIRKSDIDNNIIDTSYGIISKFTSDDVDKFIETREENGKKVEYYRFIASTDVKADTYYQYSARATKGYAIKWVDDITKKVYSGDNMLYKPLGISQYDNVLVISAEKDNVINARFKGTVDYKVYDVSTGISSSYIMPLSGAAVTMGGIGSVTNDKGEFETTEVGKYIDGTHVIKRVAVDNSYFYVDYVINTKNKKLAVPTEESFSETVVKSVQTTKTVQSGTRMKKTLVCTEAYYLFGLAGVEILEGSKYQPYTDVEKIDFGFVTLYYYYYTEYVPVYKTVTEDATVTETVTSTDTVYTINTGGETVELSNEGAGISEVNVYEGDSTYARPGTIDINDSNYTFRATVRENDDEHIKELKFRIVDPVTKKTKFEIPAQYESSSGQWVAVEKMDIAMSGSYTSGDTLYAVVSTDKNVSGSSGTLMEYLPVYTGYDFIQGDSAYDTYSPQNFNLPTNGEFLSLPMLDTLATGFNFPFVSIALEQRPTGEYRVKIGANVSDILDKAAGTNLNPSKSGNDDAGMGYTGEIDWKHPIDQLTARAKFAYDSIFKKGLQETPLLNGASTSLGPSQFRFAIIVGGYIDFGKAEINHNGQTVTELVVTGGGGYIGMTISFKKNFYFLIAGTVPAYIGGSASGTLIGNMGATRKQGSVVALSSMRYDQLDVDDALAFNGNLNASASVALYAGVGLCDVLGIRLEGDVDLSLLWEPLAKQTYAMNDEADDDDWQNSKIHELGFTAAFSLGGKVDLLLFTIPLMYNFDPINKGFNSDIQNAHVRKTTQGSITIDGTEVSNGTTGSLADGWYYIKNSNNNMYLQMSENEDGKDSVSLVAKTSTENTAMRFYLSTKDGKATIVAYDGYGETQEKYIMLSKDDGGNVMPGVSDVISASGITAYHKFYVKEPNIGYFNIVNAAEGGNMLLMTNDEDELIFGKTGTKTTLWKFEPVDDPVTNGWYKIKNTTLDKYLADADGKAVLAAAGGNEQKWYVEEKDGYITLRNAATQNYLYVDSDSQANGVKISVKDIDDSNAAFFNTTKLIDGNYHITTRYSLGKKYLSVYSGGDDVVSNDYNEVYNQSWVFTAADAPVSGGTAATFQMLSVDGVSLFSSEDNAEDVDFESYSEENDYDNVMLRERREGDSEWVANANSGISLFSGFKPTNETTLVYNSYERPDSQVVDLGGGDYMLVFVDTDSSRGELERTVLKYAFCKSGEWSDPMVIQNDGTADFQPNVADAGDNVAITWISSHPTTEKTGDPTQYLTTMEVYTVLVNKTTGDVGEITRLTNDSYYDYSPTVVYDSQTGDMAVYYIKSSEGSSFMETANSFSNDCIITYMLYDAEMGRWLTDYYYPEEVSDPEVAEELISQWGGQRFLPSPIDELGMSDPLITDFTAIGYNGLAVFGYTIDKDNDSATNEDRDLFIQVYDFTTHKNHFPIRITNDADEYSSEIADSMPRFVRAGGENGSTYLYWFRGDNKLSYINVSRMAHEGLNEDGTVSDTDLIAPRDVYIKLTPEMKQGSNDAYATMSYYKVCVDKDDNIYVIWVDLDRETNKQEIFATAVITDPETGETSYADAYQLTHSGKHNDEPAFLVDDEGNMIVVSTRYNATRTNDPVEPLEITDLELVATTFAPYGELYAESVSIDNSTPNNGDTVKVSAKLYNRGLTVAKGYTVKLCEMKGEEVIKELDTIQSEEHVNAGEYAEFNYDWVVSNNIDGVSLGITVTEGYMSNSATAQTETLKVTPNISLSGVGITQKNDGFYLHAVATNNGNVSTSDNNSINVVYYPEKAAAKLLGIVDELFAKKPIGNIAPNESKTLDVKIENVNGETFNAYGYLPCLVAVTNDAGEIISNDEISYIMMDKPIDIKVNNSNTIEIKKGEAVELSMTYSPAERYNDVVASYYTKDNSVATIADGQLVGVSEGKTTLIATAQPYGSSADIEVVVTEATDDSKPTYSGGGSVTRYTVTINTNGGNEIASLKVNRNSTIGEIETPVKEGFVFGGWYLDKELTKKADLNAKVTSNITLYAKWIEEDTLGGKVWKNPFTDVKSDDWFYGNVEYAHKNGLFSGTTETTFAPNEDLTRAMLVTVLYRAEDKPEVEEKSKFTDVADDSYYSDAVAWAEVNGIVMGISESEFAPDTKITREQIAAIMYRYALYKGVEAVTLEENLTFTDAKDISEYAVSSMNWLVGQEIIKGYEDGTVRSKNNATRAEAATVLQRFLEKIKEFTDNEE